MSKVWQSLGSGRIRSLEFQQHITVKCPVLNKIYIYELYKETEKFGPFIGENIGQKQSLKIPKYWKY